jgi:hypothetical protein
VVTSFQAAQKSAAAATGAELSEDEAVSDGDAESVGVSLADAESVGVAVSLAAADVVSPAAVGAAGEEEQAAKATTTRARAEMRRIDIEVTVSGVPSGQPRSATRAGYRGAPLASAEGSPP